MYLNPNLEGIRRRKKPAGKGPVIRFYIRPLLFWCILVLILLLPLSMNWRLVLFGKTTEGIVVDSRMVDGYPGQVQDIYLDPVVLYEVEGRLFEAPPPENVKLRPGRLIRVLYLPSDPARFVLLCFSGIFLDFEITWSALLLLFWLTFFFSFGKFRKKKQKERKPSEQVADELLKMPGRS